MFRRSPTLFRATPSSRALHLTTSVMSTLNNSTNQSSVAMSAASSSDTSNGVQGACLAREPGRRRKVDVNCIWKHLGLKKSNVPSCAAPNKDCSLCEGKNKFANVDLVHKDQTSASMSISDSKQPKHISVGDSDHKKEHFLFSTSSNCTSEMKHSCKQPSQIDQSSKESFQKDDEVLVDTDFTHMLEEHSLPTSFGKREVSQTCKPKSMPNSQKLRANARNKYFKENKSWVTIEPFDICPLEAEMLGDIHSGAEDIVFLRSSVDMENDVEEIGRNQLSEGPNERVLRPGMILLKRYISCNDQIFIVQKCRELGLGPGGFYKPGYNGGAKLRLYMMCLGLDWDPQTRKYQKRRRIDRSKPPDIPHEFHLLVDNAMRDSHALVKRDFKDCNAEEILPLMTPDTCIVNFYTETGRLGLHQDRDESKESLVKGLPVVSFSVGDSAEFLYGDTRDLNKADKLVLESGDVLIFGGKSRHVFHGISSIVPDSAPGYLQETGFRPGRLNLTFRQH